MKRSDKEPRVGMTAEQLIALLGEPVLVLGERWIYAVDGRELRVRVVPLVTEIIESDDGEDAP